MLCYGCSGACAKKYDIALFALSALWMVKVQKVQIVQSKKKTRDTFVPHVRNHPNLADSIWQMLLHFLPLDGVGPAVAGRVKL